MVSKSSPPTSRQLSFSLNSFVSSFPARAVAAWNSAYFTCPETSFVISNMLTCFLPLKTAFEAVIGVDQGPLFLVMEIGGGEPLCE